MLRPIRESFDPAAPLQDICARHMPMSARAMTCRQRDAILADNIILTTISRE
jgi:hypothetical protein